jgi:hypothetical protein
MGTLNIPGARARALSANLHIFLASVTVNWDLSCDVKMNYLRDVPCV